MHTKTIRQCEAVLLLLALANLAAAARPGGPPAELLQLRGTGAGGAGVPDQAAIDDMIDCIIGCMAEAAGCYFGCMSKGPEMPGCIMSCNQGNVKCMLSCGSPPSPAPSPPQPTPTLPPGPPPYFAGKADTPSA